MSAKIYLDTVAIISAVEGKDEDIAARLASVLISEATICVSSELALAEVMVGVWRADQRQEWLSLSYERFFSHGETLSAKPVDRQTLIRAAKLRAGDLGLKLPDAIQLATALEAGCTDFVSNDRTLLRRAAAERLSTYSLKLADLDALLSRISTS